MEFTFSPKTIFKARSFVRPGKTGSFSGELREEAAYTHDGFYYIGRNADSIDKLVKIFKRGYASRVVADAQTELSRSLAKDNTVVPEIIFCEGSFDKASVHKLTVFLKNHPVLSFVPFVVSEVELTEKELSGYKLLR